MAERRTLSNDEAATLGRRTMTDAEARGARQPTPTSGEMTREALGIDPSIQRGTILPLGRTQEGDLIMALPQVAVDVLESVMLPGNVMAGADYTPADVTRMALDVGGGRSVVGAKPSLGRYVREAPSSQEVRQQSTALLRDAQNQGLRIKPEAQKRLADETERTLKKQGVRSSKVNPKAVGTMELWQRDADQGVTWDLEDITNKRREAGIVAGSIDPSESRAGVVMKEVVDDFVEGLGPDDIEGGNPEAVSRLLKGHRDLWARQAKADTIAEVIEKAENQASGLENGLRVQFRALLNNKKRMRGFTQAERAAMEDIVKGDATQKVLRFVSSFGLPAGGANRMLGSTAGGVGGFGVTQAVTGDPSLGAMVGAGVVGTGTGAGQLAARRAMQRANLLQAMTIQRPQGRPTMGPLESIARRLAGPTVGAGIDTETGPGYF